MSKLAKEVAKDILSHQLDCMGYWDENEMLDRKGCSEEDIAKEVARLKNSIYRRYIAPGRKANE